MSYKNNVISTKNERLTSGFRIPSRPDHNGVDFIDANDLQLTEKGVDIIAFADGKVVEVIKGNLVGNTVALLHVVDGKNYLTRYQHMRDGVSVKVNEYVKKGQKLGVMGNTGNCISSRMDVPLKYRGTHLHFSVKENSTFYTNGVWVNPEPYLTDAKSMGGTASSQQLVQTTAPTFKKGESVLVKPASKWHDGVGISSWVFGTEMYTVTDQYKDGTICISTKKNGAITGRIAVINLLKV